LDAALSKMVRANATECIACGESHEEYDCGHLRRRELMATRFHPWSVAPQENKENRFEGGQPFEYEQAIDWKYGPRTTAFLDKLSRTIEPWKTNELEQLRSAARMGYLIYLTLYRELRPHHFICQS